MIAGARRLPAQHRSIRMPWHDAGWAEPSAAGAPPIRLVACCPELQRARTMQPRRVLPDSPSRTCRRTSFFRASPSAQTSWRLSPLLSASGTPPSSATPNRMVASFRHPTFREPIRRPRCPLNEGRSRTPATPAWTTPTEARPWMLNEGRSRNPGYTLSRIVPCLRVGPRSTKAGIETPATLALRPHSGDGSIRSTKAGAETPARRNSLGRIAVGIPDRSTKAGVDTPATPADALAVFFNNGVRSTKAGVETPATLGWLGLWRDASVFAQRRPEQKLRLHAATVGPPGPRPWPLNEGRSRNSGYTPCGAAGLWRTGLPLNEGRSRNSGYTRRVAQRLQRRRGRSTKAGAETPATPPRAATSRSSGSSLNEGRSGNSGYTGFGHDLLMICMSAQRRPKSKLRLHDLTPEQSPYWHDAQRRPKSKLRLHSRPPPRRLCLLRRSTKAEVETPATPGSTRSSRDRSGWSLNEGRSRNTGYTWQGSRSPPAFSSTLNEGRSRNTGYTSY